MREHISNTGNILNQQTYFNSQTFSEFGEHLKNIMNNLKYVSTCLVSQHFLNTWIFLKIPKHFLFMQTCFVKLRTIFKLVTFLKKS